MSELLWHYWIAGKAAELRYRLPYSLVTACAESQKVELEIIDAKGSPKELSTGRVDDIQAQRRGRGSLVIPR